ncbi:MAG: NAD(P)-dependent oxidoreductase [Hydrogenibacillus sp.]|nr:NAD(P)-dependent oxidoreductase [Hydrogenibacillus sp.]
MRIGMIGLGTMGRPMVARLLQAGHEVVVYNRSKPPIEWAEGLGARGARSPKAVAEAVDIVMTSLPYPETVEAVYFGQDGVAEGARRGQIWIDLSTIAPVHAKDFARRAEHFGAAFLDAPVSGGPMGAESGTLTIMIGGDAAAYERAREALLAFGKKIVRIGGPGSGSAVKLINNLLVAVHTAALSEAFVLGVRAGIDPAVLHDVLRSSTGHSYMIDRTIDLIQDRDFAPRFSIALLSKDVRLALAFAEAEGVPLELGALAKQLLVRAEVEGHGQDDIAALVRPLERSVGVTVARWADSTASTETNR